MRLDARQVQSGETIETDVCIIGGGVAGLVVARELSVRGRDIVVLESAAEPPDAGDQALNDGETTGDPYAGLRLTRHRGWGGSALLWNTPSATGPGAKYAPLDPCDLEPRWPSAPDGWPLEYDELARYYARAQQLCALGPFEYCGARWSTAARPTLQLASDGLSSAVYQMGSRDALLAPLLATVRGAPSVRLYAAATAVGLVVSRRGGAVVSVVGTGGGHWRVRAARVVVAAGAIENARLLMVCAQSGGGVVDKSGWLGRGFMEHPRDRAITLLPDSNSAYRALSFYDAHGASAGTTVVGRVALEGETLRAARLMNASATLLPIVRQPQTRLHALVARHAPHALRRRIAMPGHGWSAHPAPAEGFAGFTVLLNLEQPPYRENGLALGRTRDRHGVPSPVLTWRWRHEDQARLRKVRALVVGALERSGAGRVTVEPDAVPDPNAHHHAGTTRMHHDPRLGVVDGDGRVHGTRALYVVGASTFPTAGFANPTLTIVAMALRLAERLEK